MMCLIRLSAATPHSASIILSLYNSSLWSLYKCKKCYTVRIPGFSLIRGKQKIRIQNQHS